MGPPASPNAQADPGLRTVAGELARAEAASGIEVPENRIRTPETPPREDMDEGQTESTLMGAGELPLQICEDCQRGLPGEGEEENLDGMVDMISPPTQEESGEPVREMEGAESEGGDLLPPEQTVAGPPATDPEVKEE